MLDLSVGDYQVELGRRPLPRPPNRPPAGDATAEGPGRAQLRILIVDDEMFVAQHAASILEAAGYEIVGMAVTADTAIQRAEEHNPDLVLMDINLLGQRDGIEAALEIRQRLGIRSLFLSAYSDSETRARAAAANPLDFLPKPFTKDTLLAAVQKFFD